MSEHGYYYTVKQGEDLKTILVITDTPLSINDIISHPNNQEIFEIRDPSILFEGDQIFIPEDETPHVVSSGTSHEIEFEEPEDTKTLKLRFQTPQGKALSDTPYKLTIGEEILEGSTDSEGTLEEDIPAFSQKAEILISGDAYELLIGYLDPLDSISGIQARLSNLGFDPGPIDGLNGPLTKEGVRAFQTVQKILVDGIAGPQTQSKLLEAYGC